MPSHQAPAAPPDPRTHVYRPDLADARLRDRVVADSYCSGTVGQITASRTAVRSAPDPQARRISEAIFGEALESFEIKDGWAWVQMRHDGYVGYVEAASVAAPPSSPPNHKISATRALLFAEADLKAPIVGWLPLSASISIDQWSGAYGRLPDGCWTHRRWLNDPDQPAPDPVETAKRFLGVPYGWGGCTIAGIDCSGLAQISLMMAGLACPRDSDQQATTVGQPLSEGDALQRGDLIFFPGHVGLMIDETNLIHANATHMAVTIDPLDVVVENAVHGDSQKRGITARRRISPTI